MQNREIFLLIRVSDNLINCRSCIGHFGVIRYLVHLSPCPPTHSRSHPPTVQVFVLRGGGSNGTLSQNSVFTAVGRTSRIFRLRCSFRKTSIQASSADFEATYAPNPGIRRRSVCAPITRIIPFSASSGRLARIARITPPKLLSNTCDHEYSV